MTNLPVSGVQLQAQGSAAYFGDMSKAANATNAFGGSIDAAAKQVRDFSANVEKHQHKIGALTTRLDEQRKAFGILEQELDQVTQRYGASSLQAQKKQLALDKLSNAIKTAEGHLTGAQRALANEERALKEAQGVLATHTAKTVDLGDASERATPPIDKLGDTAKETGDDFKRAEKDTRSFTDRAGKGISAFSEIAVGALRHVGEIAIDMFRDAGRALIGFGKDSISVAGDFEAGMNRFGAAAGGSLEAAGVKLEDFRDLFIDIGKELPVSTAEVQDAAIELVKGGLDPLILKTGGLKDAINFAAAAELGLADAAIISVKQLGVWTEATATAEEQTAFLAMSQDLMVRAAGASTVNVDSLSRAMNNAGGQARALNLDYRDFVTGVTLIAPAFSSAEQAGTGFNVFLKELQPNTEPARAAFAELNLLTAEGNSVFFDAQGRFIGVAAAAEVLKDATTGLTDAKKAELLQTIFGIDGMVAANTLIRAGAEGYDILAQKIDQASGVQAAAAAKQAGYNTAMDNFKGSIEALQITIGSKALPLLTDLFNNVLAPAVNTITTLTDALSGNQEAFAELSPTLQEVVKGGQYLAQIIGEATAAFGADGAAGAVATFGAGLDAILPGAGQVAGVIADIIDTAQGVVSSLQAAGAEGGAFGGVLSDLGAIWKEYSATVISTAQAIWGIIQSVFGVVRTFLENNGTEIQAFFKESWDSIYTIITTALQLIRGIVTGVFLVIRDFLNEHGEDIQHILKNAWTIISNVIGGALDIIKGVLTAALKIFQGDWQGAWETIRSMSEGVVKRIWEVIKSTLDLIAGFLGTTLSDIGNTWRQNFESYLRITMEMGKRLYAAGSALITNLWNGAKAEWERFKGWLDAQWQSVRDMLPGSEPKDTSSPLYGLSDAGQAIFENVSQGLRKGTPRLLNTVRDSTADLSQVLERSVSQMGDALTSRLGGILGGIGELFNPTSAKSPLADLLASGEAATANITEGIETGIPDLMRSMDDLTGDLIDAADEMARQAGQAFNDALDKELQEARDKLPGSEPKDTSSPFYDLASVGVGFITNILGGLRSALPDLLAFVTESAEEMRDIVTDVTRDISRAIADALSGRASGLRTQAGNLKDLAAFSDTSDLDAEIKKTEDERYSILLKVNEEMAKGPDANQTVIDQYMEQIRLLEQRKALLEKTGKDQAFIAKDLQYRLDEALRASKQFADPKAAAQYYDLLSRQAFEFADLQREYYDAVAQGDTERMVRLSDQMSLIDQAQQAERAAFVEGQSGQENSYLAILEQIQEIINNTSVAGDMPPFLMQFFQQMQELLQFAGGTGAASPPATAPQIWAGAAGNTSSTVNNYNLGITSSQSPAVVQQGFWIMQAGVA